jgi:hypothetical protein
MKAPPHEHAAQSVPESGSRSSPCWRDRLALSARALFQLLTQTFSACAFLLLAWWLNSAAQDASTTAPALDAARRGHGHTTLLPPLFTAADGTRSVCAFGAWQSERECISGCRLQGEGSIVTRTRPMPWADGAVCHRCDDWWSGGDALFTHVERVQVLPPPHSVPVHALTSSS